MLKLFIAVVDAELLEAVFAENLKAVDVKDPDHSRVWNIGVSGGGVYGGVDLGHDPREKLVIHCLELSYISRRQGKVQTSKIIVQELDTELDTAKTKNNVYHTPMKNLPVWNVVMQY